MHSITTPYQGRRRWGEAEENRERGASDEERGLKVIEKMRVGKRRMGRRGENTGVIKVCTRWERGIRDDKWRNREIHWEREGERVKRH